MSATPEKPVPYWWGAEIPRAGGKEEGTDGRNCKTNGDVHFSPLLPYSTDPYVDPRGAMLTLEATFNISFSWFYCRRYHMIVQKNIEKATSTSHFLKKKKPFMFPLLFISYHLHGLQYKYN